MNQSATQTAKPQARRTPAALRLLYAGFVCVLLIVIARNLWAQRLRGALLSEARGGSVESVRTLLRQGADPNLKDREGTPVLLVALGAGRPDTAWELLQAGADPNAKDPGDRSALHFTLRGGVSARLKTDAKRIDASEQSLESVWYERLAADMLRRGANPNDGQRPPALIKAIRMQSDDLLRLLLEKGAQYHWTRREQEIFSMHGPPLGTAAYKGTDEAVRMLLARGGSVNERDRYDYDALMWAVQRLRPSTVKILLDAGADVTHATARGVSALSLARPGTMTVRDTAQMPGPVRTVQVGSQEIYEILLAAKAKQKQDRGRSVRRP